MKARFLTLLITLAFLGFTVSAFAKKPPRPPDDPAVVYTVELRGVFNFPAHDVTLNSKGRLNSVLTKSLEIALGHEEWQVEAWDAVFAICAVSTDAIDLVKVNFDDWGVGRNGDDGILWISLANIRLPQNNVPEKEIQIQLGLRPTDNEPDITKTFLPTEVGKDLTFVLNSYVVWGKPLGGKGKNKGWDTCYQSGDGNNTVDFVPATLVIALWEEEEE